jgi:superfamily II DNA helicase RecQ
MAAIDDVDILEAASRFDYINIKPFQSEVVHSYMEGKDVFLMAPTGSGKSFTYEVENSYKQF